MTRFLLLLLLLAPSINGHSCKYTASRHTCDLEELGLEERSTTTLFIQSPRSKIPISIPENETNTVHVQVVDDGHSRRDRRREPSTTSANCCLIGKSTPDQEDLEKKTKVKIKFPEISTRRGSFLIQLFCSSFSSLDLPTDQLVTGCSSPTTRPDTCGELETSGRRSPLPIF